MSNGYFQLPVHPDSQRYFTIRTNKGLWTSRRLIPGFRDAASPFQSAMHYVLGELVGTACIVYIDDVLVMGDSYEDLVANWRLVLEAFRRHKMKINVKKTVFYAQELEFCGRLYSAHGVRFNPAYTNTVTNMPKPANAAQLRTYLASANWLRSAIPSYSSLAAPLQELLKTALQQAVNPRQKAAAKVSLMDLGWNHTHDSAFDTINAAIAASVALAYPDPRLVTCVFTDASALHWAGVVTQCEAKELEKPTPDQVHAPLAFVSGSFTGAQLNWPTVETEAFAIKETVVRCRHLLQGKSAFRIFTDHRNLHYLFNPTTARDGGRKQAAERIERWKVILQPFFYEIDHVPGLQNVVADMFSRWGATPSPDGDTDGQPSFAGLLALQLIVPEPPPAGDQLPSVEEIVAAAADITPAAARALGLHKDASGHLKTAAGQLHVPDVHQLRQRLCIIAHQGLAGHRGSAVTSQWIRERFHWPNLDQEVTAFCRDCLVCAKTRGGATVPRPFALTPAPTAPNSALHFDYFRVREVEDGTPGRYEYVLVLLDTFSRFVELVPTTSADAASTVTALIDWFKRYSIVTNWTSDQGSHFLADVVAQLSQRLHTHHHFTTTYAPWSNGRVERVNREIRELLSGLLLEFGMTPRQWPDVLPLVQHIINTTPTATLAGHAPIEAFMGRKPHSPLDVVYDSEDRVVRATPLPLTVPAAIASIQTALAEVTTALQAHPRRQPHNNGTPVDFNVGDYVLTAKPDITTRDKTTTLWDGPALVLEEVSTLVVTSPPCENSSSMLPF